MDSSQKVQCSKMIPNNKTFLVLQLRHGHLMRMLLSAFEFKPTMGLNGQSFLIHCTPDRTVTMAILNHLQMERIEEFNFKHYVPMIFRDIADFPHCGRKFEEFTWSIIGGVIIPVTRSISIGSCEQMVNADDTAVSILSTSFILATNGADDVTVDNIDYTDYDFGREMVKYAATPLRSSSVVGKTQRKMSRENQESETESSSEDSGGEEGGEGAPQPRKFSIKNDESEAKYPNILDNNILGWFIPGHPKIPAVVVFNKKGGTADDHKDTFINMIKQSLEIMHSSSHLLADISN